MGKLIGGINGPIQGKVGTVVGSSWKGIPYIKGPYKKRTKIVSKKERANRSKFSLAQYWLSPLLEFVRQGFKGYSDTVEGFVAAKSWLLLHAFEGTPPTITINPALVKLSHGDLPLSADIAVEQTAAGELQFTWDPAAVDGADRCDQVMLLAYAIDHKYANFTTTGQFRYTGSDVLKIPNKKGWTWHLYLAFTAADRKRQSDSVYLGTVRS